MRRPRLLNLALLACLPAAGMLLTIGSAAGASTAATPSAQAAANARALLHSLSVGQHSANQRVAGHASKIQGLTQVQSGNWSGYADTSTTFSTVTGSWTEPSVTCSGRTTQLAAFWVGIDGYSSSSVEQDGTLAECYLGSLYQYTWWEMYPTNDIQVVGSSLAAGDQHRRVGGPQRHQLHAQGDRLDPHRGQLQHHPDVLELCQLQRGVDRGSAERLQWCLPAGPLQHLDRVQRDLELRGHLVVHRRRDHHG